VSRQIIIRIELLGSRKFSIIHDKFNSTELMSQYRSLSLQNTDLSRAQEELITLPECDLSVQFFKVPV
jgi:hypothetical protein